MCTLEKETFLTTLRILVNGSWVLYGNAVVILRRNGNWTTFGNPSNKRLS